MLWHSVFYWTVNFVVWKIDLLSWLPLRYCDGRSWFVFGRCNWHWCVCVCVAGGCECVDGCVTLSCCRFHLSFLPSDALTSYERVGIQLFTVPFFPLSAVSGVWLHLRVVSYIQCLQVCFDDFALSRSLVIFTLNFFPWSYPAIFELRLNAGYSVFVWRPMRRCVGLVVMPAVGVLRRFRKPKNGSSFDALHLQSSLL